jgi:hypothetical protein
MKPKTETYVAIGIILIGVLLLVANLTDTPIWPYLWPTALIVIGVWLVVRPRLRPSTKRATWRLLDGVHRRGTWQVTDEEIWFFVGDSTLDMREADIPLGETHIRVHGLVGEVDIHVPPDAGVRVTGQALVTDANDFGYSQQYILAPYETRTPTYDQAERRVHVDVQFLVVDLNVA